MPNVTVCCDLHHRELRCSHKAGLCLLVICRLEGKALLAGVLWIYSVQRGPLAGVAEADPSISCDLQRKCCSWNSKEQPVTVAVGAFIATMCSLLPGEAVVVGTLADGARSLRVVSRRH